MGKVAEALRRSLREDPDVILVGEMRDYETISAALLAAETGHLVLSTLHTTGAAQTVERIIDACPTGSQKQVRAQLAAALKGIVSQCLIPCGEVKGAARIAGTELLVVSKTGDWHQVKTPSGDFGWIHGSLLLISDEPVDLKEGVNYTTKDVAPSNKYDYELGGYYHEDYAADMGSATDAM